MKSYRLSIIWPYRRCIELSLELPNATVERETSERREFKRCFYPMAFVTRILTPP